MGPSGRPKTVSGNILQPFCISMLGLELQSGRVLDVEHSIQMNQMRKRII